MNDPELYSRSNPFQVRDATQVLGMYRKRMRAGNLDVVLDIGCGTGEVTSKVLAPSLGRFELLMGVDSSRDMVRHAQVHHEQEDNVIFEELDIAGDVDSFRREWGTFSKVFSFYCLHWVRDLRKALSNIQSLMDHEGEALLVFVAQCPVFEMHLRLAEEGKWKDYMLDVNDFVPVTHHLAQPAFVFSQMMEDAGISSINCSIQNKSFTFTSTQMLRDCMVAVNPFVKRIPIQLQNEYIEDCIKTLSAIKLETGNANENTSCCFSYKLLVAHGMKH